MEVDFSTLPVLSDLAEVVFYLLIFIPGALILSTLHFLVSHIGYLGTGLFLRGLAVLGHFAAGQELALVSDVFTYLATLGTLIDVIAYLLGGLGPELVDVAMLKGDF